MSQYTLVICDYQKNIPRDNYILSPETIELSDPKTLAIEKILTEFTYFKTLVLGCFRTYFLNAYFSCHIKYSERWAQYMAENKTSKILYHLELLTNLRG